MKLVTHPDNAEDGALIAKDRGVEMQTCKYLPVENTDDEGITGPVFYLIDDRQMELSIADVQFMPVSKPEPDEFRSDLRCLWASYYWPWKF